MYMWLAYLAKTYFILDKYIQYCISYIFSLIKKTGISHILWYELMFII